MGRTDTHGQLRQKKRDELNNNANPTYQFSECARKR